MRIALLSTALFCLMALGAAAHDGAHPVASSPSAWDGLAVGVLIVSGLLYAAGQRRLARQRHPLRRREVGAYWLGWTAMLTAVLPPLDGRAALLFSVHMVQHELLMLVGAPLMIAGRPLSTCLWGLPATLRRGAGSVLQADAIGGAWRWLTAPAVAWALHGIILWIWHAPVLYEWAVRDEGVHALQHAMFVGSAMLFWWGLIYGRYGRAGYGASVFYVFTTVVHTGLLGAVFALTPLPLYAIYAGRSADPVADQQLAGLVMWVPAGVVLTVTGIALFAAWLGEADRRARGTSAAVGSAERVRERASTDSCATTRMHGRS